MCWLGKHNLTALNFFHYQYYQYASLAMTEEDYCQLKLLTLSVSIKAPWTLKIRAPVILFSSHYSEWFFIIHLVFSYDFMRVDHVTMKQKFSICPHAVTSPDTAQQSISFSQVLVLHRHTTFDHLFLQAFHPPLYLAMNSLMSVGIVLLQDTFC